MSIFSQAMAAALPTFYAAFGRTVAYSRPSTGQSVSLVGRFAKNTVDMVDENGLHLRAESEDLYVRQADLALGGAAAVPARGDTVTDADGNLYDVQAGQAELRDSAEWRIPLRRVDS